MSIIINAADFIIVGLLALFVYLGYHTILFNSILSLIGFCLSFTFSLILLQFLAHTIYVVLELPANMSVLFSFAFLFAIFMLLKVFFMVWAHKIIKIKAEPWFDKLSGVLIGFLKGLLVTSLLAIGFSLLPLPKLIKGTETNSFLLSRVKYVLPTTYDYTRRIIPILFSFRASLEATYKKMGDMDDASRRLLDGYPIKD